jgi:hypothetical protein
LNLGVLVSFSIAKAGSFCKKGRKIKEMLKIGAGFHRQKVLQFETFCSIMQKDIVLRMVSVKRTQIFPGNVTKTGKRRKRTGYFAPNPLCRGNGGFET